jgi:hypothetical protein
MEVNFADSFEDSLKKMISHNTWWYKTYNLFRRDIPNFVKNVWRFRKPLWNHNWWDNHASLEFLQVSLTHMADNIEKYGIEIDGPRLKKVEKMRRASQLIQNYINDLYSEMAESELGELILHDWEFEDVPDKPGFSRLVDKETPEEKEHNTKVFKRAHEIESQEWNELFEILKGQDVNKLDKDYDWDWDKQFDGSGLKYWWD